MGSVRVVTAVLSLSATALLLSGCAKPVHHDFSGAVSIRQRPPRSRGSSCRGRGADADIADGTTVVIDDAKTNAVASTTLGPGTVVTFPGTGVDYSECRFYFRVTIPDLPEYTVQVSDRKAIRRGREAMQEDNWTIDIALPIPAAIAP